MWHSGADRIMAKRTIASSEYTFTIMINENLLQPGYQLPAAFVAYPSTPNIAEVFRTAIKEINKSNIVVLNSWEDSKVDGKVIINVILENIKKSDLFCADLTEINPNVLFELGYAIARSRRTWLLLD